MSNSTLDVQTGNNVVQQIA